MKKKEKKQGQDKTKPSFWKRILLKFTPTRLLIKVFYTLRLCGIRGTFHAIGAYLQDRHIRKAQLKINWSKISAEQRKTEEATVFDRKITFSILVPLYNTPIRFLDEMIDSVQAQTYPHWELCLADGSDDAHAEVGCRVLKRMESDARIQYKKLEKNGGISENTNACIDMASGNYIALFDHDDVLHPSALFEMMQQICQKNADFVYTDEATFESPNLKKIVTLHFKSDYSLDTLRANNYICHFSAFSREVLEKAGRFRSAYDGSQDHDMILRLTSNASCIVHVPKVLYFWRSHPNSVAMDIHSKTYAIKAGQDAVRDHIRAGGMDAEVTSAPAFPSLYRIRYQIPQEKRGKVSILIPNKDNYRVLKKCIHSIFDLTTYPNYEILIIDNGSDEQKLLDYYKELVQDPRVRVLFDPRPFNFSAMNNGAAKEATGEYLVLLNNDIEIITPEWIEELLMYVQRENVGIAGAMLYYPNNQIQHAGIALGLGEDRIAGHLFHRVPKGSIGYMGKCCYSQNLSAVTAACMMVKKRVWEEVGGMDESFPVAFNDVDFCLRVRKQGYLIAWTPHAEAYHHESLTRGEDKGKDLASAERFQSDCQHFRERWSEELAAGDPYYNSNFSLDVSYEPDLTKYLK